jgi:hypothetical protein
LWKWSGKVACWDVGTSVDTGAWSVCKIVNGRLHVLKTGVGEPPADIKDVAIISH